MTYIVCIFLSQFQNTDKSSFQATFKIVLKFLLQFGFCCFFELWIECGGEWLVGQFLRQQLMQLRLILDLTYNLISGMTLSCQSCYVYCPNVEITGMGQAWDVTVCVCSFVLDHRSQFSNFYFIVCVLCVRDRGQCMHATICMWTLGYNFVESLLPLYGSLGLNLWPRFSWHAFYLLNYYPLCQDTFQNKKKCSFYFPG